MDDKARKKAFKARVKAEQEAARLARHEKRTSEATAREKSARAKVRLAVAHVQRELRAKGRRFTPQGQMAAKVEAAKRICDQLGLPVEPTLRQLGLEVPG